MGEKEFERHNGKHSKTGLLILQMMQTIWYSNRVLIMDSRFCVLKGLIELVKRGVYGSVVIKKCWYWPRYIKGDEIDQHFDNKPVRFQDYLPRVLENVLFHIYPFKEEDYVMKMMSTYGTNKEKSITKRFLESTNQ